MIDLNQAVVAARHHIQTVFSGEVQGTPRLEEIWLDDGAKQWFVTFGFFRKPDDVTAAAGTFSRYEYKVVKISNDTGLPISIKNRDLAGAA